MMLVGCVAGVERIAQFRQGVDESRHALRRLRPGLLAIASSGKGEKAVPVKLNLIHTNAVLDKPYAAETLLRTVNRVLTETDAAIVAPTMTADQKIAFTR